MKNAILFTSLAITLALGLVYAPALRADESDYSPTFCNEDEVKEQRSFMRPFLEPSYIPSAERLASYVGANMGRYTGKETPEQLKAMSATCQTNYDKIVAALPEKLSVPVARKRKILVLCYRSGMDYHVPGQAGYLILLREAAKKYGTFELTEAYKPDGIDAKMLAGFDVVVVNSHQQLGRRGRYGLEWGLIKEHPEMKEEMAKRQEEEMKVFKPLYEELLPAFVKNGGGLVGIHATALLEAGRDDKGSEFTTMLGGVDDGWCHPHFNGKLASTGQYCPIPIKILEPNNPLTFAFRDAPKALLNSELFSLWLPKSSMNETRAIVRCDYEKIPGLTYNDKSEERCKDFASAIIWIKSYGKGRVYFNVLGHDEEIIGVPCVARAMLDGLLYATGDLKVPDALATAAPAGQ